jgi:hypothetical protein
MNFSRFPKFKLIWFFSFAINIIAFFWLFFKIHPESRTLALHYNIVVGVDLYGKGYSLYLIPFSGLVINAVNYFLYKKFTGSKIFYKHLFSFTSLCCQLILFLAVFLISRVN